MTLRLAPSPWRTDTFRRLNNRLENVVGAKTAKAFEPLKLDRRRPDAAPAAPVLLRHRAQRPVRNLRTGRTSRCSPRCGTPRCTAERPPRRRQVPARRRSSPTDGAAQPDLLRGRAPGRLLAGPAPPGARGIFAGKVGAFRGEPQLTHPDFVIVDEDGNVIGGAQRNLDLGKVAGPRGSVSTRRPPSCGPGRSPAASRWRWTAWTGWRTRCRSGCGEEADLMSQPTAYRAVHRPDTEDEVTAGVARVQFDEAFGLQLAMARRRAVAAADGAVPRPRGRRAAGRVRREAAVRADRRGSSRSASSCSPTSPGPHPMQRLLQGEVGSGKTVVALRAMLTVVDNGGQAALLAPTEVLAAQHHRTITAMLGDLVGGGTARGRTTGTGVTLITGRCRRRPARGDPAAASGEAGIVIGTHALLTSGAQFADLGLVVVDEQHRFGVEQRAALAPRPSSAAHPGDDRDAHPALRGHDRLRRPGDVDVDRDPRRPGRRVHRGGRHQRASGLAQAGLAAGRRGGRRRAGRRTWSARGSQRRQPTGRRRPDAAPGPWRTCTPSCATGRWPAAGGDAARPAAGRGEGRGDGAVRRRRARRAGGHHRDRGRGRRAQRLGDGDLRRRPLRDLPAAPAPRPDRPRRPPRRLPAAHRRRGRTAGSSGWTRWPGPGTGSCWPRSIWPSAGRATCSGPASRASGPACGCCGCSTTRT